MRAKVYANKTAQTLSNRQLYPKIPLSGGVEVEGSRPEGSLFWVARFQHNTYGDSQKFALRTVLQKQSSSTYNATIFNTFVSPVQGHATHSEMWVPRVCGEEVLFSCFDWK